MFLFSSLPKFVIL